MAAKNLPFEFLQRWPLLTREFTEPLSPPLVELLDNRDRDLEDFLGTLGGGVPTIDLGESAVLTGWSKTWRFGKSFGMSLVVANLEVIGTTPTVLWVVRNSVDTVQVTIPASTLYVSQPISVAFAAGDRWQIRVESAGNGAVGLSVFAGGT